MRPIVRLLLQEGPLIGLMLSSQFFPVSNLSAQAGTSGLQFVLKDFFACLRKELGCFPLEKSMLHDRREKVESF